MLDRPRARVFENLSVGYGGIGMVGLGGFCFALLGFGVLWDFAADSGSMKAGGRLVGWSAGLGRWGVDEEIGVKGWSGEFGGL